ncbi:unnamed protein product [Brassicogethes aeneus]|uniref:Uncharacterized protein n=1 Tax=Brassicogethes aeneus TaxID=1431903 RepID=A0A9P0FQ52_BRAAE|nr:unnamed protein product [Brassicogethes aeneus]
MAAHESSGTSIEQNKKFILDLNENMLCVKKTEALRTLSVKHLEDQNSNIKKRSSFHQNVDEALSSLLWQPYEYQNRRDSLTKSSSNCSVCSSSSSSLDLEESPSDCTDLFRLVNNLSDSTDQSRAAARSRDPQSLHSTHLTQPTALSRSLSARHGYVDAMQLLQVQQSAPNTVLSINSTPSDNNGLRGTVHTPLSSANVIGIPRTVYTRNESSNQFRLPISIAAGTASTTAVRHTSQIEHFRSASVPKSMPQNQHKDSNFVCTVPSTAQPNNNGLLPNHARMHSEPSLKNKPTHNISNVNVNFYRAVPVNVVSSVPTIQCINSTGSNVSNVQIMPQSVVTGTTQVTVHSTPNHSLNIPTNYPRSTTNQVVIQNRSITTVPPAKTCTTNSSTQISNRVSSSTSSTDQVAVPVPNTQITRTRTFTSTEAQTDDISVCPADSGNPTREQRRRERRERRNQRRTHTGNHRHAAENGALQNDRLPDILNSHLPPPYSTLPSAQHPQVHAALVPNPVMMPNPVMVPNPAMMVPTQHVLQTVVPNNVVPNGYAFTQQVVPGQVPLVQGGTPVAVSVQPPTGFRFPFPNGGFRRGRFSEESPKGCCGILSWKPGSLRWFIALIALVAVCCVLIGTALGAMRPAGRDHLTVSLLMIGVGIVLVTVSGVAWRLTSHDSSTCRSMLGLGSTESVDVCTRRFVPRLPPSYGRPHHPYAAMMYPEFQYRPPPPSYQASMQEYRLRLLLLDRGNAPQIQGGVQNVVSPPPTYRSHAGSLLRAPLSSRRDAAQSEYSCPPSYRSQNSSNRQNTLPNNAMLHSREQSLSLSESNNGGSVVNVVNILGSTEEDIALDNITLDSLKMDPESDINPLKMLLKATSTGDLEGTKDGNLVTIVQTSDQSPVIVTVSGSSQLESNTNTVQITEIPSEMEILAHL